MTFRGSKIAMTPSIEFNLQIEIVEGKKRRYAARIHKFIESKLNEAKLVLPALRAFYYFDVSERCAEREDDRKGYDAQDHVRRKRWFMKQEGANHV